MPQAEPESSILHDAFISYSRRDTVFAAKLESSLEAYRTPKELKRRRLGLDVFRDVADFTGVEYGSAVRRHLAASAKLIVVCSPHARASRYVTEEIRLFAQVRGTENIIPLLLSGVPNNEATPEQREQMAFPDALCEVLAMPLAVDYRRFDAARDRLNKRALESSWFSLLANILDVSRDDIEARERRRQARRRRVTTTVTAAIIMVLSSALAVSVMMWRRAEERTAIAQSRQLALAARMRFADRLDSALLLAVNAYRIHATAEARAALLAALTYGGRLVRFIHGGRPGATLCAAFGRDAKVLATGGCARYDEVDKVDCHEGIIEVWDVATGRRVRGELRGHADQINAIAFLPDGTLASSSAYGGTLIVWDIGRGEPRRTVLLLPPDLFITTFSADGRLLAAGSFGGAVAVWDVVNGCQIGSTLTAFQGKEATVSALAFSSNGKALAAGSTGGSVALFDLTPAPRLRRAFQAHHGRVYGIAFDPRGEALVTTGEDRLMRRWSLRGRASAGTTIAQEQRILAFTPDGKAIVASGEAGTVRLWDATTGETAGPPLRGVAGTLRDLAVSADGAWLATVSKEGGIVLWSAGRNPSERAVLAAHRFGVETLTVDRSARPRIASAGCSAVQKKTCSEWEIRLWNGSNGASAAPSIGPLSDPVEAMAFIDPGSLLAFSEQSGTATIWDAAALRERRSFAGPIRGFHPFSTSISGDGTALAVGGCGKAREETGTYCSEGEIWLSDIRTGRSLPPLHGHAETVAALAFHPAAPILASGGGDGSIILWDWQHARRSAGPWRAGFTVGERGSAQGVYRLDFFPDGKTLAVASGDSPGEVVFFDVATRARRGSLMVANERGVGVMAVSPDGAALATDGERHEVLVWDLEARELLYPPLWGHAKDVRAIRFSADGRMLVSGSEDGMVRLWELPVESLESRACRMANRELTDAERAEFLGDVPPLRCSELARP